MPQIIDLSHPMQNGMPIYPGTEAPNFEQATTIQANGYAEKRLTLFSHTGTHLDAPAHMLPQGASLSDLPPDRFMGPGCILDLRGMKEALPSDLEAYTPALEQSAFAILRTGWEQFWGTPEYFHPFPVLTEAAAIWLTGFNLFGIGTDAISVDEVDTNDYPIHHVFFTNGLIIVENLCNLEQLPRNGFDFQALPLPIVDGDGSPVRAIATVI
ncbi:cyclase family protein [Desulfovibrio ferrophilus]|uniref:Putative metal-dependent hydrolase n=1 Tax=Desulfovibrio ferrophilus TaxID=241368 RepID=A0A2Z6AW92_9BACT|nr:cyclase family protein [Desulfovibrio ferrophilus]BBD07509.1 putative metal-dependent hydrolase [Desulfovibrio ferrophilus]